MRTIIELLKAIPVPVLIAVSVIFVTLGDYYGKKWSVTNETVYFVVAAGASLLSGVFYFPVLFKHDLVTSSIIWTVLSILAFVVIGVLVYKEVLTPVQLVGAVLGIISILILSWN
jgi:drug/metabolite transporter (DMT)-like permease